MSRETASIDGGHAGRTWPAQTVSTVRGACLAVRRAVFFEVSGFEAALFPNDFGDVDLYPQLVDQKNLSLYTNFTRLYAPENIGNLRYVVVKAKMCDPWTALVGGDFFHNPNLGPASDDFDFAVPPRAVQPWLSFEPIRTDIA